VLVVQLVDETAWFLPAGTFEGFRADLGLTYVDAGAVLTLAAGGAVAGVVFSVAADHCSRRLIAAGGAGAFSVALGLFAAGASFPALATAAFLAGMAATAMVDAAEVALVDLAGDELRRCLTRLNLLGALGAFTGPALVAVVAVSGASWRVAFWTGSAMLAVYALLLAASPLPPPTGRDGEDSRGSVLDVVRDRRLWVVGALSMLLAPFDEPFVAFTIALLEQGRGLSAGTASIVAVVGMSGGLVAFAFVAPRLQERRDRRLLMASGMAMGTASLLIASVPFVPLVAAAAFAASVALNLAWLAVQHRTLALRPGQVGTAKAVVSAIELTGLALPVGIGAVADRAGLSGALGVYAFLGLAIVVIAALALDAGERPGPPVHHAGVPKIRG
jgi:predicted MFS family arabinose efflux permease